MKHNYRFILKPLFYPFISLAFYHTPMTYAGTEQICEPNLALDDRNYNACSNLPILYPFNDNQTNIILLLSDLGLANIKAMTPDVNLWDATYGTTPFDASNLSAVTQNKIPNQRKTFQQNESVFDERCTTFNSGHQTFINQIQNQKAIPNQEQDRKSVV